jgi:hypothetical protein
MKQEPCHPTTTSLCSVADVVCTDKSYWVKTTKRGTPTKKNTCTVDDKSTSRPWYKKTIKELFTELDEKLNKEIEDF